MTDQAYDPTEFEPADNILQQQQNAQVAAMFADRIPADEVARAKALEDVTSVPAPLILPDTDKFVKQQKAQITSELLRNDKFLRDYANSDPYAASLSQDDWANLSKLGTSLDKYGQDTIFSKAVQGFEHGFGPPGSLLFDTPKTLEQAREHPYAGAGAAALATMAAPFEYSMRVGMGGLGAILAGGAQAIKQATGADLSQYGENAMQAISDPNVMMSLAAASAAVGQPEIALALGLVGLGQKFNSPRLTNMGIEAAPWLARGQEPLPRSSFIRDVIAAAQAKLDAENRGEVEKDADGTLTKDLHAPSLEDYIEGRHQGMLGIPIEEVQKLYGDKIPMPDDNLFGWVPNIREQMALASEYGGDIEFSKAAWLAYADPEMRKALDGVIRDRVPNGMTEEEAEKFPERTVTNQAIREINPDAPPDGSFISSMRKAAGTNTDDLELIRQILRSMPEERVKVGEYYGAVPTDEYSARETEVIDAVVTELNKLFPVGEELGPRIMPARRIEPLEYGAAQATTTSGLYTRWVDQAIKPLITFSLEGPDPVGTARHEAIHALKSMGFLNPEEWKTLEEASRTNAWIEKHNIEERYPNAPDATKIEESIAEEFRVWRQNRDLYLSRRIPHPVGAIFQKILDFINRIHEAINRVMGREVTATDLFRQIARGDIGAREPTMPFGEYYKPSLEVQSKAAVIHAQVFKTPAAVGLNAARMRLFEKWRDEVRARDDEESRKHREMEEEEKQTQAWKDNFGDVRKEMDGKLRARPDIAADRLLRLGEFRGDKVRRPKIDRALIPPEFLDRIPEDYVSDAKNLKLWSPDALASQFGYSTGEQMLRDLAQLEDQRKSEDLTPAMHYQRIVDAETEREMRNRYGNLQENIAESVKDHITKDDEINQIDEEIFGMAQEYKLQTPLRRKDIEGGLKAKFDAIPNELHSYDKYVIAAGRARDEAEDAVLTGDVNGYLKAKQEQMKALLNAKFSRANEKNVAELEKLGKQFGVRPDPRTGMVRNVPAEQVNWMHDILMRTMPALTVKRTANDLAREIDSHVHKTLREYTDYANDMSQYYSEDEMSIPVGQKLPIPEFLLDPNYRKTVDRMLPPELKGVVDSLKALRDLGRDERKTIVKGEKEDLEATVQALADQTARAYNKIGKDTPPGSRAMDLAAIVGTHLINMETKLARVDLGNPYGIFTQAIIRPIFEGINDIPALEKKYTAQLRQIIEEHGDFGDFKKRQTNVMFKDPYTGKLFTSWNWENTLSVLANAGNREQLTKTALGYGIEDPHLLYDPENGTGWLTTVTTKADWDRMQALGKLFERMFEEAETMYRGLRDVAPARIELQSMQTPWGTYDGWYYPLIPDPNYKAHFGDAAKNAIKEMTEGGGFYRPSPAAPYTKGRTGAVYPVLLNFEALPFKMKTIINDIAMRPAITDVAKIMYHPKFEAAISQYLGREWLSEMKQWLREAAGQRQYSTPAQHNANTILGFFRDNIVSDLIGGNLGTVEKHGPTAMIFSMKEVGFQKFAGKLITMFGNNPDLGEKEWKFARYGGIVDGKEWGGSTELQRRIRTGLDTLTGTERDLFEKQFSKSKFLKLRDMIQVFGSKPVALSDLLSAVPTWLVSYQDARELGESHGDAVFLADRAVRRAHGTTSVAGKAAVMRYKAAGYFVPFYNFFSTALNRQYEVAWKAKMLLQNRAADGELIPSIDKGLLTIKRGDRLDQLRAENEFNGGLKGLRDVMGGAFAYILAPAIIEQLVSPVYTDDDSYTEMMIKSLALGTSSSWPGIRDVVGGMMGGHEPSIGLYAEGPQTFAKLWRDAKEAYEGDFTLDSAHAAKLVRDFNFMFGVLTGLTNDEVGKLAQYIMRVQGGDEEVTGPGHIYRGIRYGKGDPKPNIPYWMD